MSLSTQHRQQVWEKFWDQKRPIQEVYSNADRILQQIRSLGPAKGKRIMEVGAGSGRDGLQLAREGARVIFLDYAGNALRVIQAPARASGLDVHLVRGDAFRLPFKDNALDLVFHQGLLEHFTHPLGIVLENQRVVKSGGHVIVDVPHRYHVYTVVKHILIALNKWFAGWETEFSRPQLETLFRSAGLNPTGFYGDWMRPSFFYRVCREILKKTGLALPLYPRTIPVLHSLRQAASRGLRRIRMGQWTFMDIGVIGTKP